MDARSEQTFVARFQKAKFDSTLILITHRTSLLSFVDRVIIMEYGKIAGMGTTDQFQRAQTDKKAAAEIVKNAVSAQTGKASSNTSPRSEMAPQAPEAGA
jgi:ATP-binding cassette subfamily C protein LapB